MILRCREALDLSDGQEGERSGDEGPWMIDILLDRMRMWAWGAGFHVKEHGAASFLLSQRV
jgi:hypothetical protein